MMMQVAGITELVTIPFSFDDVDFKEVHQTDESTSQVAETKRRWSLLGIYPVPRKGMQEYLAENYGVTKFCQKMSVIFLPYSHGHDGFPCIGRSNRLRFLHLFNRGDKDVTVSGEVDNIPFSGVCLRAGMRGVLTVIE